MHVSIYASYSMNHVSLMIVPQPKHRVAIIINAVFEPPFAAELFCRIFNTTRRERLSQ